jgi:DNA helicase HerA-like ATPase
VAIFEYRDDDALGRVMTVDTATVVIRVENVEQLRQLQVNRLVALQSSRAGQHLVGLVQKVTRRALIAEAQDPLENQPMAAAEENLAKVALVGTLIDKLGDNKNVFRRSLETVPEVDARCFALEGDALARFMKVVSSAGSAQHDLSIGCYTLDESAEAYLNGNKLFQRHLFIGGSTGSGKSCTTARILEEISRLPSANSIVFDVHGEYAPIGGENVQHFKVAGPTDIGSGRGLQDGVLYLPYWLLGYEALISLLVDRSDANAPNQAMIVAREIVNAKKTFLNNTDRQDILDSFTVDSPVPFDIQSLKDRLEEINTEMVDGARGQKQGEFHGRLSRLIARLEGKVTDRRLGFLFSGGKETLQLDWLDRLVTGLLSSKKEAGHPGVKVVDFSEVPSDVLPLVISLLARLAFSVQQWTKPGKRHPIALFCDEAHLYIPERAASDSSDAVSLSIFERIAKEGRKYGAGLVVISQRPSEVNRTVLSQCSNFIAMRMTNADDQNAVKRLLPDSLGGLGEVLPILDVGEALVVGDASLLPSRIRVHEPRAKPNSGTVDFWDSWAGSVADDRLSMRY